MKKPFREFVDEYGLDIILLLIILFLVALVVSAIEDRASGRIVVEETETCTDETEKYYIHKIEVPSFVYPTEVEVEEETETIEVEVETEQATQEDKYGTFIYYDFLPMSEDVQMQIFEVGKRYELNYEFLLAWAMQESSGNPWCQGDWRNGEPHAFGLYQIQPQWWNDLANDYGLYDYRTNAGQNCEVASIILTNDLAKTYGDLNKALSLFRWGRLESCVEPDGRTYEQHIFGWMEFIDKESNGK